MMNNNLSINSIEQDKKNIDKKLININIGLLFCCSVLILMVFIFGIVMLNGETINLIFIIKYAVSLFDFNYSFMLYSISNFFQILIYIVFLSDSIRKFFQSISFLKEKKLFGLQSLLFRLLKNACIYYILSAMINIVELSIAAYIGFILGFIVVIITDVIGYVIFKRNVKGNRVAIKDIILHEIDLVIKTIVLVFLTREFIKPTIPNLIEGFIGIANSNVENIRIFVIDIYEGIIAVIFEIIIIVTILTVINEDDDLKSTTKMLIAYLLIHLVVRSIIIYASCYKADIKAIMSMVWIYAKAFIIRIVPLILLSISSSIVKSPLKRLIKYPDDMNVFYEGNNI